MPQPIIRAYRARVDDVNRRERSIVAKINTSCVDYYRTVIDPRGIDLGDDRSGYRGNPVVLWEHGRDPARGSLPVGRNGWVRPAVGPNGPELVAKTGFYEKGKKGDEFTEKLFEMYADEDMRGFSVNVVPDESRSSPPTHDEIRERPELKDCVMMYRGGRLAEYSAVAVPGNPEALTVDEARSVLRCVSRGLALPADLVARARRTAGDDGDGEPPAERRIVKEGDKWCVYSEDGKRMGEYDSKAEAEKRLAEIEYFKHHPEKSAPPAEPQLPPLGGRSYDERRAEVLAQMRGLFAPAKLAEDLRARADLARGKV